MSSTNQAFGEARRQAAASATIQREKAALTAGKAGNGADSTQVQLKADGCNDLMFAREGSGGAQIGTVVMNPGALRFKSDAPLKFRNTGPSALGQRQIDTSYLPQTKLVVVGGELTEVATSTSAGDSWYAVKRS